MIIEKLDEKIKRDKKRRRNNQKPEKEKRIKLPQKGRSKNKNFIDPDEENDGHIWD